MKHNYEMSRIDYQIFLNIGQSLLENENSKMFINTEEEINVNRKSIERYKEEYLYKLNTQLEQLKKNRINLLSEYNSALEFHKKSINKINYINKN